MLAKRASDGQGCEMAMEAIPKQIQHALQSWPTLTPVWGGAIVIGDSLEVLAAIPSGSVDLLFADPPYFLSNGGTSVQNGARVIVDKGDWDVGEDAHLILRWHERWLRACQRVLRPSGTIWVSSTRHSLFAVGFAMQRCGFHLLNQVEWVKPNAAPDLGRRMLASCHETLLWAAPARYAPLRHRFAYDALRADNGGKQLRDVWTIPTTPKSEKAEGRHPTMKPLELLRRVITASSKPGDLVVDPFLGSGTTAVASAELGRRFIGIELDQAHAELAARRVAATLTAKPQEGSHEKRFRSRIQR